MLINNNLSKQLLKKLVLDLLINCDYIKRFCTLMIFILMLMKPQNSSSKEKCLIK